MISAITLENFKGISEKVTIPIRPLTIMFGKNSAGKSTVVQALHYAREIFERDNLNADRTMYGGSSVDLGGFRNLVNNHDENKAITIGFRLDLSSTDLPDYDFSPTLAFQIAYTKWGADTSGYGLNNLTGEVKSAEIELKIEFSETINKPVITKYKIQLNGDDAIQVLTSPDGKNIDVEYNIYHKLINAVENWEELDGYAPLWENVKVYDYQKSLPDKGEVLVLKDSKLIEYSEFDDIQLTQMLVGTTDLLRERLSDFRYLGPLRIVPPRNFQPALTIEESDWSNGLAAWRELFHKEDFFFDLDVLRWLEKLKTGYRIELKNFREVPLDSKLMIALLNKTVFDDIEDTAAEIKKFPIQRKLIINEEKTGLEVAPTDIGVGISQVVPVIVSAVASNNRIIAVEQPELHLHPAMQAELGDLFIESALGDSKNFCLIETHSEHLILRILRRIRECTEGEKEELKSPNITPADVQLLFIEPMPDGTVFHDLPVTEEGDFEKNVPGGFFAERAKELF
jgi:predicted ATPase